MSSTGEKSKGVGVHALTDFPHVPGVITAELRGHLAQVGVWGSSWFNWDPLQGKGRSAGKLPLTPKTQAWGDHADPATAGTFDEAVANIPKGGGVGVLVTNAKPGIVFLDFDHVVTDGVLSDVGREVVEQFKGAYVELSPSGTGLRVLALGTVNTERQRGAGIEVYPAGVKRWLRMTGAVVRGTAGVVAECQSGIDWAVSALLSDSPDKGDDKVKANTTGAVKLKSGGADRTELLKAIEATFGQLVGLRPALESDEVLGAMLTEAATPTTVRARTLAQALKGNVGKWNNNASDADFFLYCEAVRRGCNSVDDVQEVVNATKLRRDKWREKHGALSYLELTAGNAAKSVLSELVSKVARGKGTAAEPEAVGIIEAAGAKLTRSQSGRGPVQAGFANIVEVLRLDPDAKGLFAYDLFKGRMYRVKSLTAMDSKAETTPGPVTDDDYRRVALYLHRKYGMKAKLDDVRDAVKTVAKDERFDPVRDSLEKLGRLWDRTVRLDSWLTRYMKIDESVGDEYVLRVSRACLIQAVLRVFEPGAKAEIMPVFVGPGGEGKGKAFNALADAVGSGLFTNGGFDLSKTSDIIEKCRGRLIVEAAELDCIKRTRDVSAFKAAMSVQEDTHRKAYESESEDFKRTFTIWGSSNEDEFITDASDGQGRRVWPLLTLATRKSPIDIQGIQRDGGQLWAEAVVAYQSGELSYFDAQTDPKAAEQWSRVIDRCRVPDPLDDALDEYLMQWALDTPEGWRGANAIATAMGLSGSVSGRVEKKDFHALAEMLKARGLKRATACHVRGWVFTAAGRVEYRNRAIEANFTRSGQSKVVKIARKQG